MMVGVTKWSYKQSEIDARNDDCDYYEDPSENCKNEAWFIRELSQQLMEKFDVERNMTFAFMDSFSQSGSNLDDEIQQIHWIEETKKLWTEATQRNETFDFKTIDEVLEDNAACKEENENLLEIVKSMNETIHILQEEIFDLNATNKNLIEQIEDLQQENANLKNEVNDLKIQVDQLQNETDALVEENTNLKIQLNNLLNQNEILQRENDKLEIQVEELQSENENLSSRNIELEIENGNLKNQNAVLQGRLDDFTSSQIIGLHILTGSNGCNICDMSARIQGPSGFCSTGHLVNAANNWEAYSGDIFGQNDIGSCYGKNLGSADESEWSITVYHERDGGWFADSAWIMLASGATLHCKINAFLDGTESTTSSCSL